VSRDDKWGSGSKRFLRELFEKQHADYGNFFNDILEPLFYEALRVDRSHEDGYYSRFNCKIPFLNGGLFDPIGNYDWVHTDIKIPDNLFSNTKKTREGDTGTGILDVFDRYNFTVREDEPLEREVAIDPELLGKAYEKFNAIRPDNFAEYKKVLRSGRRGEENKFNKKFGVYYTPREIVHYMCQQSLINYLVTELKDKVDRLDIEALIHIGEQVSENEARVLSKGKETKTYSYQLPEGIRKHAGLVDDKLAEITVCDPAVGSGAFPLGMMSEIVRARNVLSKFVNDRNRTPYEFKRRCIEHSLYGVDIDPGAVEIAKLRLWLSLVVDEDDIKHIRPLPNLDYRIMQGNSLISEFMGISFESDTLRNSDNLLFRDELDELIGQFQKKKDKFLNESHVSRKSRLRDEVDSLLIEIFESKLRTQKADYFNRLGDIEDTHSRLPNEEERNSLIRQSKQKLYEEFGFNLDTAEEQLKEFTSGRQVKSFFLWSLYFSEVTHQESGFDVVIGNPPYVQIQKLSRVQKDKLAAQNYQTYSATADIYCLFYERGAQLLRPGGHLCFITSNQWMRTAYGEKLRQFISLETCPNGLLDLGEGVFDATTNTNILLFERNDPVAFFPATKVIANESLPLLHDSSWAQIPTTGKPWILSSVAEQKIREKMESSGIPLEDWDVSIYRGVLTGYNEAFMLDNQKREELIAEDSQNSELIKPILNGRDIKRYQLTSNDRWLLFIPWHFPLHEDKSIRGCSKKAEIAFRKMFPSLYNYLNNYRGALSSRNESETGIRYEWYALQRCAATYYEEFAEEKIVWGNLALSAQFSIAKPNVFINAPSNMITGRAIRYLIAILNSRLGDYYVRSLGVIRSGGFFEYKPMFVKQLPVPKVPKSEQQPFIDIVRGILSMRKTNPEADISKLEAEIDKLVYELYGLTPEEIKIVEGKDENAD